MMNARLDDLLYTLDLCADSLPFDLLPVHIQRLQTIKDILTNKATPPQRAKATILHLLKSQPTKHHEQKD